MKPTRSGPRRGVLACRSTLGSDPRNGPTYPDAALADSVVTGQDIGLAHQCSSAMLVALSSNKSVCLPKNSWTAFLDSPRRNLA